MFPFPPPHQWGFRRIAGLRCRILLWLHLQTPRNCAILVAGEQKNHEGDKQQTKFDVNRQLLHSLSISCKGIFGRLHVAALSNSRPRIWVFPFFACERLLSIIPTVSYLQKVQFLWCDFNLSRSVKRPTNKSTLFYRLVKKWSTLINSVLPVGWFNTNMSNAWTLLRHRQNVIS